jgi:hypothetical protein
VIENIVPLRAALPEYGSVSPPGALAIVNVDPFGVIVTLDPAARVRLSWRPLTDRTTWPLAMASGEDPVPAPARLASWVTDVRPEPPPPV